MPSGAVPYGYAPQPPMGYVPAMSAPQPTVTVTVTTAAPMPAMPMMPAPHPIAGYPGHPPPMPAMPAQVTPVGAAPAPYAPGWTNPNAPQLGPGSASGGESSLALRDPDGTNARDRYAGDAGSVGALSIATSGLILATALATVTFFVVPVGAVLASAAVASGVTGGLGIWLLRQRKRSRGKVDLDPELQVRLLDLAAQKKGRLTVTSTAQGLGLTLDEAEKALQSMARSHYVDVELDPDVGVVTYVFRELAPPPAQLPANSSEPSTR